MWTIGVGDCKISRHPVMHTELNKKKIETERESEDDQTFHQIKL